MHVWDFREILPGATEVASDPEGRPTTLSELWFVFLICKTDLLGFKSQGKLPHWAYLEPLLHWSGCEIREEITSLLSTEPGVPLCSDLI